jgi:putative transposase
VALPCVDRVASGAGHRATGDRHRVASPRPAAVLDLEEPPTHGAPDRVAGGPGPNSDHVTANALWGAPPIHGELLKLGIAVCQATVAKYMVRHPTSASQTWRTFLDNPVGQIMAADFFVVPAATCRLLFVLVIIAHKRRRVVHVAVTVHPTAAWTAQQLREAFPWAEAPRYLVRDRDHAFDAWANPATAMGVDELRSAPHSAWQNAYVERFIGSVRRGVPGPRHRVHRARSPSRLGRLRRLLSALANSPRARQGCGCLEGGRADTEWRHRAIPHIGGLHHRYERRAA